MTLDLIFLAKGRVEYTVESVAALVANTDWQLVRRLVIYTDGQPDPAEYGSWIDLFRTVRTLKEGEVTFAALGGPVNIMLDYLKGAPADVFAKIDNDVVVPPGWLNRCVEVMRAREELDLLGIEPPASRTRAPWRAVAPPAPELMSPPGLHNYFGYAKCDAVGGIGLFRSRAWRVTLGRMSQHSTYGGFTDWQLAPAQRDLVKGWVVPPLELFLLDRLPFEPWVSLGKRYQDEGLQRAWTMYDEATARKLSAWWLQRGGI